MTVAQRRTEAATKPGKEHSIVWYIAGRRNLVSYVCLERNNFDRKQTST